MPRIVSVFSVSGNSLRANSKRGFVLQQTQQLTRTDVEHHCLAHRIRRILLLCDPVTSEWKENRHFRFYLNEYLNVMTHNDEY
jgi:hypothetical protein